MVFSFFKKHTDKKMPERPAARPKAPVSPEPVATPAASTVELAPADLPDLEFSIVKPEAPPAAKAAMLSVSASAQPAGKPLAASSETDELDFTMSEFERGFTESNVMAIDVDHGGDPLQADIEQVAVLYANGQDAAARSLLDIYTRTYPGQEGVRFWWMYFDLLQQLGDRAGFEKLCVEFAQSCEMSPPTWREQGKTPVATQQTGVVTLVLQGVLTADNLNVLAPLSAALEKKQPLRIDCSKLVGCDDAISEQLGQALLQARRRNIAVGMDGTDALLARLQARLVVGQAEHLPAWVLMLELLQRFGTQEAFEEKAVDYAVTFELSPPSWETAKVAALPASLMAVPVDDAHYLSGELRSCKFDELKEVFERSDSPILDFSAVRRLDFFSAGQLVNRLAPLKAAGREVVIRSPNHLVAELMAVVGLNKFARILVPKS